MYGRVGVNVALNRPTFAISEKYITEYGEPCSSSKAVDGNRDPDLWKPDSSCFRSKVHDNPWWAVDLGAALAVVGVLFTNRGDRYGNVSTLSLSTCHRELVIPIWNSLPDFVVSAGTTNTFKNRLDKFCSDHDILYDYKADLHGIGNRSVVY